MKFGACNGSFVGCAALAAVHSLLDVPATSTRQTFGKGQTSSISCNTSWTGSLSVDLLLTPLKFASDPHGLVADFIQIWTPAPTCYVAQNLRINKIALQHTGKTASATEGALLGVVPSATYAQGCELVYCRDAPALHRVKSVALASVSPALSHLAKSITIVQTV